MAREGDLEGAARLLGGLEREMAALEGALGRFLGSG